MVSSAYPLAINGVSDPNELAGCQVWSGWGTTVIGGYGGPIGYTWP